MEQVIVKQCCRACYKQADKGGKTIQNYEFSPTIEVGVYSKEDFDRLVGEKFYKSGEFAKFCEIGWISVVKTQDITKKVASKSLDIL